MSSPANFPMIFHAINPKENAKNFSILFLFRRATRGKIWGDVSRVTGDIDYPKAAPVARSRPGELDVGRFYRRENPDRDWLIGKLIEKEYIRNTTTATDMYLAKNKKEKKKKERNIGKASKRISVVKLFQNKTNRSIDRRRSVSRIERNVIHRGKEGRKRHRNGC